MLSCGRVSARTKWTGVSPAGNLTHSSKQMHLCIHTSPTWGADHQRQTGCLELPGSAAAWQARQDGPLGLRVWFQHLQKVWASLERIHMTPPPDAPKRLACCITTTSSGFPASAEARAALEHTPPRGWPSASRAGSSWLRARAHTRARARTLPKGWHSASRSGSSGRPGRRAGCAGRAASSLPPAGGCASSTPGRAAWLGSTCSPAPDPPEYVPCTASTTE